MDKTSKREEAAAPRCGGWKCKLAKLVRLEVGDSMQTGNGFLTARVPGWYCPVCAASYGDFKL